MRILALAGVLCVTACQLSPLYSPGLVLAEPPPSFDRIESQLQPSRCGGSHRQYEFSGQRTPGNDAAPLEVTCYPQMPPLMTDLGIQASCTSVFDLDAAGVPINRVSRCDVGHARYPLSAEWQDYSKRAFGRALDGMYANVRYAKAEGRPASERRSNVVSVANFGISDERFIMKPPLPFQREGAPPLPESVFNDWTTER